MSGSVAESICTPGFCEFQLFQYPRVWAAERSLIWSSHSVLLDLLCHECWPILPWSFTSRNTEYFVQRWEKSKRQNHGELKEHCLWNYSYILDSSNFSHKLVVWPQRHLTCQNWDSQSTYCQGTGSVVRCCRRRASRWRRRSTSRRRRRATGAQASPTDDDARPCWHATLRKKERNNGEIHIHRSEDKKLASRRVRCWRCSRASSTRE